MPHTTAIAPIAVIVKLGSTNPCPYRIQVQNGGHVNYRVCHRSGHQEIPVSLAHQFFADLEAAQPLDTLPFIRCQKSILFGTTTVVLYAGTHSSDLSCPNLNVYVTNLYRDVTTIQLALKLCLAKRSPCI